MIGCLSAADKADACIYQWREQNRRLMTFGDTENHWHRGTTACWCQLFIDR
jgi:hypothetical protein